MPQSDARIVAEILGLGDTYLGKTFIRARRGALSGPPPGIDRGKIYEAFKCIDTRGRPWVVYLDTGRDTYRFAHLGHLVEEVSPLEVLADVVR